MKKHYTLLALLTSVLVIGCEQELTELTPPPIVELTGEPGSADFTKFISIGNSLTAGFQAGALFNEGQANSFPSIMAKQFAIVSENDEFNQPDINSVNGYNSSVSIPGVINLGRLILFDPDGATDPDGVGCLVSRSAGPAPVGAPASTRTCPSPQSTPAVPVPYNIEDLPTPFTEDKTKLNNFGVPGILLNQALIPDTGNPASPFYNALWARFASDPGVKSILEDALATNPTFFSFWLGNNDVLGYATTGGLFPTPGGVPLTEIAAFQTQYTSAITALLATNANVKGVVATIPDVTTIPFFRTVTWDAINLTPAGCDFNANGTDDNRDQVNALNAAFGGGYNAALGSFTTAGAITAAEATRRRVVYTAGRNGVLIRDETLTDLTAALSAINPGLAPYGQARQATAEDLILLSAGGVLGTCAGGNPAAINGVSIPLADQFALIPTEITEIKNRTVAFNTIISDIVAANSSRLALVNVNAKFTDLVTGVTRTVDGIPVNATFAPPTGLFSEDGVHPNNRGSAYIARIFIEAINSKFGATVPLPNIATYKSTGLPVSPPL
jgi:lysophospholipase L1-like esterase